MTIRALRSGGQTGVDRAALAVAVGLGVPVGGWCPRGRWAEDGPIDEAYSLRETPSAEPAQRTAWNVRDADATLILSPEPLVGGTRTTRDIAERLGTPCLVVDPWAPDAADRVRQWLAALPSDGLDLNVAGPRESEAPGVQRQAGVVLADVLGAISRG